MTDPAKFWHFDLPAETTPESFSLIEREKTKGISAEEAELDYYMQRTSDAGWQNFSIQIYD